MELGERNNEHVYPEQQNQSDLSLFRFSFHIFISLSIHLHTYIYFKELAHVIAGAGKSEVYRAGWQAGNSQAERMLQP